MIVRKVPPLKAPGARKNDHNLGPLQDLKAPLTKNGLLSWLRTPTLTHLSMVLSMDMLSPKCANALSPCLWASSPHMCKCLLSACVGVLSRRLLDNMAQPPWLGWKKKKFPLNPFHGPPFPRSSTYLFVCQRFKCLDTPLIFFTAPLIHGEAKGVVDWWW